MSEPVPSLVQALIFGDSLALRLERVSDGASLAVLSATTFTRIVSELVRPQFARRELTGHVNGAPTGLEISAPSYLLSCIIMIISVFIAAVLRHRDDYAR